MDKSKEQQRVIKEYLMEKRQYVTSKSLYWTKQSNKSVEPNKDLNTVWTATNYY